MSDSKNIDSFTCLTLVPVGTYKIKQPWYKWNVVRGYLSVEKEDDGETSIMYTSHKETHNPLVGKSRIIDISHTGEIVAYYETAVTLWLKWGYGKGNETDRQNAITFAKFAQEQLIHYNH